MLNNDYKKMFNEVIDNNLNLLQTLDNVEGTEGAKVNDKARRQLEKMYKTLRENIKLNIPLTAAEILFLGTAVNLTLATLKTRLRHLEKTLDWYGAVLVPAFEELQGLESGEREILIDRFYKKFAEHIVMESKEVVKEAEIENSII